VAEPSAAGRCVDTIEIELRVSQTLPHLPSLPGTLHWIRDYPWPTEALVDRLRAVPGMRWGGADTGILGDPGDHWPVTFHVAGGSVVAVAAEGFTGGAARCDAHREFGHWFEEFLDRHVGPVPNFP